LYCGELKLVFAKKPPCAAFFIEVIKRSYENNKNAGAIFEQLEELARRVKPEKALPIVWQCPAERQWLCPLAGRFTWM
jgi:hypothetical protein